MERDIQFEGSKPKAARVRADMAEQPGVLEGLLERREEFRRELEALVKVPPEGVLLAGRGSSANAAIYGRYVLEAALRRPAQLAANSIFTRYHYRTRLSGWLVVGVSQSGATPEVAEVLESARLLGARTLAVTNVAGSPVAAAADSVIVLGAGEERAVPATKTYTATLFSLALIAQILGEAPWPASTLARVPELVEKTLCSGEDTASAARLLAGAATSVYLGRGFLYGAALESALKMRETARLAVQGWSMTEFLHGPIAASDARTVAVLHVGSGVTRGDSEATAEALAARGAGVVTISSTDGSLAGERSGPETRASRVLVPLPEVDDTVAAAVHAIRGQQLAVEVALARGLDPDDAGGLTKVSVT
jgi:glucosamine--fructose-6-phosphate aminotransferase (isomerizing)